MNRSRQSLFLLLLLLAPMITACGTVSIETRPYDPAFTEWGKVLAKAAYPEAFNYELLRPGGPQLDSALEASMASALGSLQSLTVRDFIGMTRLEQVVFLINAHNMHAVRHVLGMYENGGSASSVEMKARIVRRDIPLIGKRWSLEDLRNEVMSDQFYEAKAIFSLNWGMRGNVPLPPFPLTAENYKTYILRQTREFVQGPGHVEYLKRKNILYVSDLIKPYVSSFERDYTTLWKFFEAHAWPEDAELIASSPPRIRFTNFDSALSGYVPEKMPVPVVIELNESSAP